MFVFVLLSDDGAAEGGSREQCDTETELGNGAAAAAGAGANIQHQRSSEEHSAFLPGAGLWMW